MMIYEMIWIYIYPYIFIHIYLSIYIHIVSPFFWKLPYHAILFRDCIAARMLLWDNKARRGTEARQLDAFRETDESVALLL